MRRVKEDSLLASVIILQFRFGHISNKQLAITASLGHYNQCLERFNIFIFIVDKLKQK